MKIEFGKLKIGVTKKIMNLIVQLLPNITPLILDQFTCSLPKNVTTFHRQQDGINHFCLSPNKGGVLALWIHIFTKIFPSSIAQLHSNCQNTPFIGTETGLDTMTILTIRYKTVIVNHEELRHRNKGGNTNQGGLSHRDFELL